VADTDGDGIINCMDHDDDDDGLCEVPGPNCTSIGDPCPEVPGSFCIVPDASAPCPPLWTYCAGPCLEQFIRFHDLINPDPIAELRFDSVWVVNDTLFAAPQPGRSAAEDIAGIAALAGVGGVAGAGGALISGEQPGYAAAAGAAPILVVELWRRDGDDEHLVDVIGRFQADQIALGDLTRGGLLRLKPTSDDLGRTRLEASVSPGIGITRDDARDRDADGQADAIDNCVETRNPGQRDGDGNGFGDACDVDFDGDGITDDGDVARVRACAGADLLVGAPISEPAFFDGEPLGDPTAEPDPIAVALASACAMADLDGDWDVDDDDAGIAEERLGRPPGPSAFGGSGRVALPSQPGCASSAAIDRAKLVLAKLDRAPGEQEFAFDGRLPLAPAFDPAGKGLSLRISDAMGDTLLEAAVPGGPQWRQKGNKLRYRDDTGAQAISRIEVRADRNEQAEFVNVKVVGKAVGLGSTSPALPLVAEVSLDPDAPASLQCGETAFGVGPGRPHCDLIGNGSRVLCR